MCTDGDKSEETKTPKSRHELNTGRMQPFILTGLHTVLLPICIAQHLLMDMDSCHVSAHSTRESIARCNSFIHFILLQQSAVTSSSNSQWAGQKGYKALTTAHKVRTKDKKNLLNWWTSDGSTILAYTFTSSANSFKRTPIFSITNCTFLKNRCDHSTFPVIWYFRGLQRATV